ncbi:UV radiation resistance protein and autophagy-related subunit 14-domain-containing protein [Aspergillus pseudoustus]|uniref:Autophagy-related protein 14 n=1 Tax=Aspergillus pseudoustus TaxID=1810923 RepID=A0ABR4IMN5_9EURO
MSCDICARAQTSRLRLICPTCARNSLYQLRLDSANVLLDKEYLGQQIKDAVTSSSNLNADDPHTERGKYVDVPGNRSSNLWALRSIGNKQAQSFGRTKTLAAQIESLSSEIQDRNVDISKRRLELARRRSDSESAKYQLTEREAGALTSIQNNHKRTDHLWNSLHTKTAEARIFLCREVASLYGLRQKVKKRDNGLKESYMIGGVNIFDLRDMNGAAPDQISTSFSYIAHMVVLVSHYLSLRLPAEITLPHRDYPTPTIYTPSASYHPPETTPTKLSISASSSSPTATISRTSAAHVPPPPQPRPRPLCIDKSLPKLAKEDPGTYGLFIEGVTLLAWNVSWLCRSQGLNLGSDSWEDVCDIGKNLWQLLVAPPGNPSTLVRTLAGRDTQAKNNKTPKDSPRTTLHRTKSFPMLGHYSHGTAHSFLGASEGTEFTRNWRLPAPTKVTDRLKSTLLGEMASAEWEVLEQNEWADAPQASAHRASAQPGKDPDTSMRGSHQARFDGAECLVSKIEASDAPSSPPRPKGTSGWTKLRNR